MRIPFTAILLATALCQLSINPCLAQRNGGKGNGKGSRARRAAQTTSNVPDSNKPNVIILVVDDLGWGDVGYNGSKLAPTPNIDKLAASGVVFTNAYASAAVCAPSRCGIVSGAYQEKFGIQINADYTHYIIPESQKLLPQTLKTGGYHTALVGKWHVSRKPDSVFDEVHDPIEISSNYFPDSTGFYGGPRLPIVAFESEKKGEEYMTDRLTREAMEYLDRSASQSGPFFLYLGYNAVHNPWQAPKRYYDRVKGVKEDHLKVYAAQIAALDDNIGILMGRLAKNGQDKNTFIFLVSDNGPAMAGDEIRDWEKYSPGVQYLFGQTNGLKGHKAQLHEGGIRTPMLMVYPPRFFPGKVVNDVISSLDIYPTVCEITGTKPPEGTGLDGVSLVPVARGEARNPPHEMLFWRRLNVGAVRMGIWKLYLTPKEQLLYDLQSDPGETHDLSTEHAAIRDRMAKAWTEWCKQHPENASKGKKPVPSVPE